MILAPMEASMMISNRWRGEFAQFLASSCRSRTNGWCTSGKRVDGSAVEADDLTRSDLADRMIIKRRVSRRSTLVVEIEDDLRERHVELQFDAVGGEVMLADDLSALTDTERMIEPMNSDLVMIL